MFPNYHFDDNNADVYDITTDTPTNNFCTMNPLANAMGGTLAEGNLKLTGAAATDKHTFSTFGFNDSIIASKHRGEYQEKVLGTVGSL